MAIKEVSDIQVYKNGAFHTMRDQKVFRNVAWQSLGVGSGVRKGEDWYVLCNTMPLDIFGQWMADSDKNTVSNGKVTMLYNHGLGLNGNMTPIVAGSCPVVNTDGQGNKYILFNKSAFYTTLKGSDTDSFTIFKVGNAKIGRGFDNHPAGIWYAYGWSIYMQPNLSYSISMKAGATNGQSVTLTTVAATQKQMEICTIDLQNRSFSVSNQTTLVSSAPIPISMTAYRTSDWGFIMGGCGDSSAGNTDTNGCAYELIVYNRVLTEQERLGVVTYLKNKYTI